MGSSVIDNPQFAQLPQSSILAPNVMDPTMSPHAAGVSAIDDLIKAAPNSNVSVTFQTKKESRPGVTKTSANQLRASPLGSTDISQLMGGGDKATQALIDQLVASSGAIQPNQQYIQALGQMGQAYTDMPARTDLTPLTQLVDQWSGSQFAKGYKPPDNAQSQQAIQMLRGIVGEQQRAQDSQYEALAKAAGSQLHWEKIKRDYNADLAKISAASSKSNLKLPEQSVATALREAGQAISSLHEIGNLIKENSDIFGPTQGLKTIGPSIPGYNERNKMVNTALEAAIQNVGRPMEGGVLKKDDIVRYRKMMPSPYDTPVLADFKHKFMTWLTKKSIADFIENQIKIKRDMSEYLPDLADLKAELATMENMDKYVSLSGEIDPGVLKNIGASKKDTKNPIPFVAGMTPESGQLYSTDTGIFQFKGGKNVKYNWIKVR